MLSCIYQFESCIDRTYPFLHIWSILRLCESTEIHSQTASFFLNFPNLVHDSECAAACSECQLFLDFMLFQNFQVPLHFLMPIFAIFSNSGDIRDV